jgi:hypothetical protein
MAGVRPLTCPERVHGGSRATDDFRDDRASERWTIEPGRKQEMRKAIVNGAILATYAPVA